MGQLPIPNVWVGCVVKVIDDSTSPPRWKTIGECAWTPNAIQAFLAKHNLNGAWVVSCVEKSYVTRNPR